MRIKKAYILIVAFIAIISVNTNAQRRVVVRHPSRTVVVTRVPRAHVTYVSRRPVPPPVVVRAVPPASVAIVHGRVKYYYHAGVYYTLRSGNYVVVAPPRGLVVATLPPRCVRVVAYSTPYYYSDGIFYEEVSSGYETVDPPSGAIVESLPETAKKVSVDGRIYYECNGTLYSKVETASGYAYQVSASVEG